MICLYVVQQCWFSGPHVRPPMDYLRLLPTARDAEQVAYASAHWYANNTNTNNTNNNTNNTNTNNTNGNNNKNAVVRTIQLPKKGNGFVAAGQLFWVRPVRATPTTGANNVAAALAPVSFGEAHCIVSRGIILGDNDDSHNNSSIFVGPHSSHAALQLLVAGTSRTTHGNNPPTSPRTVQWVPVGPPPSLDQLAQEWPSPTPYHNNPAMISSSASYASCGYHSNNNNHTTEKNPTMEDNGSCILMDDSSSSSKRTGSYNAENEWFHTAAVAVYNIDPYWGTDLTARPAKRACRPTGGNTLGGSGSATSGGSSSMVVMMED